MTTQIKTPANDIGLYAQEDAVLTAALYAGERASRVKEAARAARVRLAAGEVSSLYCDVAHFAGLAEKALLQGGTREAQHLVLEAHKLALIDLGTAIERLMALTGRP